MSEQIWWYATRAAGLMTWATAMTSIVLGLLMSFSNRPVRVRGAAPLRLPSKPWLLDVHRFLGGLSLVFLALHMITLWADSFVHFAWAELLVPGASEWRPVAVAWGVVAAWLLVAVEASSMLKQSLPPKLWHRLHLGSYLVAGFGTAHGLTAGSDAGRPVVVAVGGLLLLLVVGLTVARVATIRSPHQREEAAMARESRLDRARQLRDNPRPHRLSLGERFAAARSERPDLFDDPPVVTRPEASGSGQAEERTGGAVGREHAR